MGWRGNPVSKIFALQSCQSDFNPQHVHKKIVMVAHAFNPSVEEKNIGRS